MPSNGYISWCDNIDDKTADWNVDGYGSDNHSPFYCDAHVHYGCSQEVQEYQWKYGRQKTTNSDNRQYFLINADHYANAATTIIKGLKMSSFSLS